MFFTFFLAMDDEYSPSPQDHRQRLRCSSSFQRSGIASCEEQTKLKPLLTGMK